MSAPVRDRSQQSRLDVSASPVAWREWVTAAGSWAPDLSPDGVYVVYVSDCSGSPRAWVAPVAGDAPPRQLPTGRDYVDSVSWSADGEWIAVLGAPGGESTRTRVWVVRPDGRDARRVAGVRSGTATFGPWLRSGAVLPLSTSGRRPEETSSTLLDVHADLRRPLGEGAPFTVQDLSHDGTTALIRVGTRGRRTLVTVDLDRGTTKPLLPVEMTAAPGTTDLGFFLPDGHVVARSDVGRMRPALVLLAPHRPAQVLAARPNRDLDTFAVSHDGRYAALVWNAGATSEVELLLLGSLRRIRVGGGPEIVDRVRFSADGRWLVVAGHGLCRPGGLWASNVSTLQANPSLAPVGVPGAELADAQRVVPPSRELVQADDGLLIEGWLYRPVGRDGAVPTVIYLHGGPEAQERPGFMPLFQALVASGIAVFAPNVRGSAGYGREFEQADNGALRHAAISDVAACALHLLRTGLAQPDRLACMGRSYGGYLTLAALTFHPELFAAGVDVCGMSDLLTFYQHTEPWVGAVATTKYGDPVADAQLLADLSPLRRFHRLRAPLLAVHGVNDRNVPVSESHQAVAAARAQGVDAELLLFPDEGHEIVRPAGRLRFVEAVVSFLCRHLRP